MALSVKRLLLLIAILFSSFTGVYAQTLYWVGGSGTFNDPSHWSLTSGGSPVYKAPDSNTDVVFDRNSGIDAVVEVAGKTFVRNIECFKSKLFIVGDPSSELNISGFFKLNSTTRFDVQGKLIFNSTSNLVNEVYTAFNDLNCDFYFKKGNWQVSQLITNKSINVDGSKFQLINGYIKCNDFITDNANITFSNSGSIVKNKN